MQFFAELEQVSPPIVSVKPFTVPCRRNLLWLTFFDGIDSDCFPYKTRLIGAALD
jgi:hypothetical protein